MGTLTALSRKALATITIGTLAAAAIAIHHNAQPVAIADSPDHIIDGRSDHGTSSSYFAAIPGVTVFNTRNKHAIPEGTTNLQPDGQLPGIGRNPAKKLTTSLPIDAALNSLTATQRQHVTGVVLDVVVDNPSEAGVISIWGHGTVSTAPAVSYQAGVSQMGSTTVPFTSDQRTITLHSSKTTHATIDVVGFYLNEPYAASGFVPSHPITVMTTDWPEEATTLDPDSTSILDVMAMYRAERSMMTALHGHHKERLADKEQHPTEPTDEPTLPASTERSAVQGYRPTQPAAEHPAPAPTKTFAEEANRMPTGEAGDDIGDDQLTEKLVADEAYVERLCAEADALRPEGIRKVVLSITATSLEEDGELTLWTAGSHKPGAATMQYQADVPTTKMVVLDVDDAVALAIHTTAMTNVDVSIHGFITKDADSSSHDVEIQPVR